MDSCNDTLSVGGENQVGMVVESMGRQDHEAARITKWKISKSHKRSHILRRLFAQFIKEIVEGMIGYVHLPTIMSKLLSDNGGQEFGDFKVTILGMLGTYGFERRILDTAKSLIEDDTYYTMSLLKKGASHGYAPRSLQCCICNCVLTKISTTGIRVFNCGHATHIQCEFQENEELHRGFSLQCPVCMPTKKGERTRKKTDHTEYGLVNKSLPRHKQTQASIALHSRETDASESSKGILQIPRFEILANLQRDQRVIQIENVPQLRLAPPAVYHEKVRKGVDILAGDGSSGVGKVEQKSKNRRLRELKPKGTSTRFPLKSTIFGKEKNIKR